MSETSTAAAIPDTVLEGPQDWADAINTEWRKTIEGILGAGALLVQAKESLPHGEWGKLWECERPLTFGDRAAQYLMSVSRNDALANPNFSSFLPPSYRTLSHLARLPADVLEDRINSGDVHPELKQGDAFRLYKEWKEANRDTEDDHFELPVAVGADVRHGDFRHVLDDLPDGSVNLILTDPPYPKDDLPLYSDLSKHASRLLADDGLLLAYAGNMFLPEVLARLGEHLDYGWSYCLLMDEGSQSRIMGRHIIQRWKPILAFCKGSWPSSKWQPDVVVNPERQKDLYEWQQGIEPLSHWITTLSSPGDVVLDPFLGVGSTGVAAILDDRHFVGVELNEYRYRISLQRISEAADAGS